jgi:hypothetical protein
MCLDLPVAAWSWEEGSSVGQHISNSPIFRSVLETRTMSGCRWPGFAIRALRNWGKTGKVVEDFWDSSQ